MLKTIANWLGGVKAPPPESRLSFRVLLNDLEVGELERDGGEWVFRYSGMFRAQDVVKPIVDFPHVEREYRAAELWPFFLLRIPSPTQPEVQRRFRNSPVRGLDEGMLLREFGRWAVANPFELRHT